MDVRFGPSAEKTRIVFDLDGPVDYRLSADRTGAGRIFVDLTPFSPGAAGGDYRPGKGHVARYGFAANSAGAVQTVIELKATAKVKEAFIIPPSAGVAKHRLVIDLVSADLDGLMASVPGGYPDLAAVIEKATSSPQQPQTPSGERVAAIPQPQIAPPSLAPDKSSGAGQLVIVIDAGHGGADPGAQGAGGTLEKTVTLAAAKELKDQLESRGGRYRVVLLRGGDNTIRPDKREAAAREAGADLFISLHADAIATANVRGASVYTLSEQGTARSATLAKSQGDYQVYDLDLQEYDPVVSDILFDKAQQITTTESTKFAELLIEHLAPKTQMLNRSHRTGDLRVLLAPDVPAVLLEMAFISNVKDEANLKSPVWRKRAMGAVADAIDGYFDNKMLQRQASRGASAAQR